MLEYIKRRKMIEKEEQETREKKEDEIRARKN
jgi:hypothetical protein